MQRTRQRTRNRFGLVAGVAMAALVALGAQPAGASNVFVSGSGPLRDLDTAHANPTDGATARVFAVAPGTGDTYVTLIVHGLDREAAGETFGAHVHTGTCVAGSGAAAGPHYNAGGAPSPTTEVWLDFTVLPGGVAVSQTVVPFEIPEGAAHAVVIHAHATDANGGAGARIACLPVDF